MYPLLRELNAEEEAEEGRAGRVVVQATEGGQVLSSTPSSSPSVARKSSGCKSSKHPIFLVCAMWRERSLVALYLVRESSLRDRSFEGREKTVSERDYLAKEEALRRLSEPEGDHELHAALERMRESHPHLWEVLHRVHLAGDADPSKLEEWRRAPDDSQEQIWASHYDRAMGVLAMAFQ
jgi:hypothetical protein